VALTKAWDAYAVLRSDLSSLPEHAELLSLLEAWHAIHEGRYDAAMHAARTARAPFAEPGAPSRVLAHALKTEAVALFRLGRYREAETLTRSALDLFRFAGDRLNVSHCATNLGLVLNALGELTAARSALARSVEALVEAGAAEERLALARVNLGVVELHLGNAGTARELFESSLAAFERLGLRSEKITALNGLGHCARALAQFETALRHYRAALRLAGCDFPRQVGLGHEFMGRVHLDRGDNQRAARHYRRALEVASHIAPDGDLMLEICWHYAEFLISTGRVSAAAEYVERAEALCASSEERRELGCVQRARARLLAAHGDRGADAAFRTAFETLRSTGRVLEAAHTLVAHAEVEAGGRRLERATALLREARALLQERIPGSGWIARIDARLGRLQESAGSPCPTRHGFLTRPRPRRLLRRIARQARPARAGRRRHALPRRDRRYAARAAGQAPARARRRTGAPGRRGAGSARRRQDRGSYEPAPRTCGGGRALPLRPVPSARSPLAARQAAAGATG
jgi:tetratricopeptide (TPR) repeat protein